MARTCCPQYTIRLDSLAFKPNKKQKQVMNRWGRYLSTGETPGSTGHAAVDQQTGTGCRPDKGKGKGKAKEDGSWVDTLRTWETLALEAEHGHRFEVSSRLWNISVLREIPD